MRKFAAIMALFVATLALAGCGSDSGCGALSGGTTSSSGASSCTGANTGGGTSTTNTTPSSVSVTSSSGTVPGDGTAPATISAVVKNSDGVALSGVSVTFTTTAGALASSSAVTSTSGGATTTLTASGVANGTALTVTATVGSLSGATTVTVGASSSTGAQTLTVVTNAAEIPSDGSSNAIITVLVRNSSNQLVPGVAVNFTATSGGIVPTTTAAGATAKVPAGTTDAQGSAAAILSIAGDPSNRTITVTAATGAASAQVTASVVGTQLTVTGPASLVMGAQGTYNVALTNSSNVGIATQKVALTSASGNTLNTPSVTTDNTGHATFQLTAAKAGNDTLSAAALGMTAGEAVAVSNQSFSVTAPAANATIVLGQTTPVTVVWQANGAPQANQTITISTTRGVFAGNVVQTTVTTDGTGTATANISSTTAGPAVITASGQGVTAEVPVIFEATNPTAINVQASPASISIQGQSTITATLRDAQNNLVQGQTVNFQLTDNTGGTLSVAFATTNGQGQAQTVYTASTSSSATNGVIITATVQGTALTQNAELTVGGQSVFLSLGTGNKISENGTFTQFVMPFTVQAIDASGNAVNGAQITLSVHSDDYGKGGYVLSSGTWVQTATPSVATPAAITVCQNEDLNQNGILDPGEDGVALTSAQISAGWIFNPEGNQDGKLEPGNVAAVAGATNDTVTTADGGVAAFTVTYPEDHANWVQVTLTATTTVQGTQAQTSMTFWLPILASYLTSSGSGTPPGFISPYGVATQCTNPN
jgi:Invasin, domain 3/Bacterial Ig-like domain (group 1)